MGADFRQVLTIPNRIKYIGYGQSAKDIANLTEKNDDKPFLPLGEYEWPKLPTDDRVRLALALLNSEIFRSND